MENPFLNQGNGVCSQIKTSDEEVSKLQWFDLDKLPSKEKIAFDHGDAIELYKKYLKENFPLPVLG